MVLRTTQFFLMQTGADSLLQHAKNLGKEDCLRVVQLDVTKDSSVLNAKVSLCDSIPIVPFY